MKNKIYKSSKFGLLFFLIMLMSNVFTLNALSQDVNTLLEEGIRLKDKYKDAEALNKFEAVLKIQPNNVKALHNASWLLAQIGDRKKDETAKRPYFERARDLAKKAIKLDNNSAEAHYSYVKSLGLLSEIAGSTKEELKNAKIIKTEAEKVLKLDPDHSEAHYVLGRWHEKLSDLAWYEVSAAKVLFGGVPEGASFEKAIYHYKRAISIRPWYVLYYFGIAETYVAMDEKQKAITVLEKAVNMKIVTPDDPRRLRKCRNLLAELKK